MPNNFNQLDEVQITLGVHRQSDPHPIVVETTWNPQRRLGTFRSGRDASGVRHQCARRTVQSSRILFRSAKVTCGVEVVGFVVQVFAYQGSQINFKFRGLRFAICVSSFKV